MVVPARFLLIAVEGLNALQLPVYREEHWTHFEKDNFEREPQTKQT